MQYNNLNYKKYINSVIKTINLGAKNGPVGWNGLTKSKRWVQNKTCMVAGMERR